MTGFKRTRVQTLVVLFVFMAFGAMIMYHEHTYSRRLLKESAPLTGGTKAEAGKTEASKDAFTGPPDGKTKSVNAGNPGRNIHADTAKDDDGAEQQTEDTNAMDGEIHASNDAWTGPPDERRKDISAGSSGIRKGGDTAKGDDAEHDDQGSQDYEIGRAIILEQGGPSDREQQHERKEIENTGTNGSERIGKRGEGDRLNAEEADFENGMETSGDGQCTEFLVYDKPVKTGSTSITRALKEILRTRQTGSKMNAVCERSECLELAEEICDGKREPVNLVRHIQGKTGVLECLRSRGYYVATSIRDPLSRWESAFQYNRREKGKHFGIPWESSYEEFMQRIPACALFFYFDGMDSKCRGKVGVPERVKRIVARYDEIIDLEEEPMGMLERLMKPFLKRRNSSPWPEGEVRGAFDRKRLENETMLYEALKRKRMELLKRPKKRQLCRR